MPDLYLKAPGRALGLMVALCLFGVAVPLLAQTTNEPIYTDSLQNGWQNWGWATLNYANTSPVHSGSDSISVTMGAWEGIQLYHADMSSTPYASISFWLNGGASGGQHLQVYGLLDANGSANDGQGDYYALSAPAANTWQQYTVPLPAIGVANQANFTGFVVQSAGTGEPVFYLDDISLIAGTNAVIPPTTNPAVSITVNALLNRKPISPLIYGVAFATSNQLADLNCPINRSGGNSETRYNWLTNAHNRAADFYFESIADSSTAASGAYDDAFVAQGKAAGAASALTIPMIGYTPILGPGRGKLASYSIAKYGPQTGNDSKYFPDAGNGISVTNNTPITWNNPLDANTPVGVAFQQAWVSHLTNTWGLSSQGGVGYYLMDNEHSIWFSTHQDIHPVGPTMQEILGKMESYAAMVKSMDSNALVLGPEEWGWSGYFYSGYDQQWSGAHGDYNTADYPDRRTNGGWDYLPWMLNQLHTYNTTNGQRLLDYFTVHCYPQSGESGTDTSTAMELLRNKSTRSLWDTNYVDASWINAVVMMIPRMRGWVNTYYPGTKIGITEYDWGADAAINGATAQADILGIFGREGLDLATRWTVPDTGTPAYLAFKMYRNYDGNQSTFGDTSVSAVGPDPDNLSVFGGVRSKDGALTVMVVNKQLTGFTPAGITFTNFPAGGTVQSWQLGASNVITRLSDLTLSGTTFSNLFPAQTITLFVLPAGGAPTLRPGAVSNGKTFSFLLNGLPGQSYSILASSNLVSWQAIQTNTLTGTNAALVTVGATNSARFYRAEWIQ